MMRWADWIVWAMAHPEDFPLPERVDGLPSDEDLLALYAHLPERGHRALEVLIDAGLGPTGATPTPVELERRPIPVEVDVRAAQRIASVTDLSLAEAVAVVEVHGPDLHPARAVRLHRRMKEASHG